MKDIEPVKQKTTWHELFGRKQFDMPDRLRRERWEQWKALTNAVGDKDIVEQWADTSDCNGCMHLDKDWCKYAHLPCTVNPILTMVMGMIGMACQGVGYEAIPKQQTLF